MNHSFNIDIAAEYGIEEAVMLNNLMHWVKLNKANEKNYFDGYYWSYNSQKSFSELYPYMTKSKVYRVMKKLEDEGLIIKSNYNKMKYDRTLWYTLTDKAYFKMNESISQFRDMEITEMSHGNHDNESPIPDINTDIKKDINTYTTNEKTKKLFELYNEQEIIKHKNITQQMRKNVNARLKEQSFEDLQNVIKNYSEIYKDEKYFYKVKLRFDELMGPDRVARFLDESEPFDKHLDYNKNKKEKTTTDFEALAKEVLK